ncbi:putative Phytocyanin domain, cupredoxin [Arabidopsis thaliana]
MALSGSQKKLLILVVAIACLSSSGAEAWSWSWSYRSGWGSDGSSSSSSGPGSDSDGPSWSWGSFPGWGSDDNSGLGLASNSNNGSGWGWGTGSNRDSGSGSGTNRDGSRRSWNWSLKSGWSWSWGSNDNDVPIIVGGSDGWKKGLDYKDWASKNAPFYVNDVLVFKYDKSAKRRNNVYLFKDRWSYMNCDIKNARKIGSTRKGSEESFNFTLKKIQPYFFASGEHDGDYCRNHNMKFTIFPVLTVLIKSYHVFMLGFLFVLFWI